MSLTAKRLREIISYNQEDGSFVWVVRRANRAAGMRAGVQSKIGYHVICIDSVTYYAHRLAWLYVHWRWPENEIDHINGIKYDNRLVNLREATSSQNSANSKVRKDSVSGLKGAYYDSNPSPNRRKKWYSWVVKDGKKKRLGYFETKEEAHIAYCIAAKDLFGEYARYSRQCGMLRND